MRPYLFGIAALAVLVPTVANAQEVAGERPYMQQTLPAPAGALELSIGTGYTQGFGKLERGVGMPDVVGAGISGELDVGYRINPRLGILAAGQYQEFNAQSGLASARGFAGTVAGQFHFVPRSRLDPFLEVGAGYRLLWENVGNNGPTILNHGFQFARARAGIDIRLSEDVAIAPVVGADTTVFLWQDVGAGSQAISSPTVSTFIFAGVQGRFDIGGTKVGNASLTYAEPSDFE